MKVVDANSDCATRLRAGQLPSALPHETLTKDAGNEDGWRHAPPNERTPRDLSVSGASVLRVLRGNVGRRCHGE
jgi:hypothetical protein